MYDWVIMVINIFVYVINGVKNILSYLMFVELLYEKMLIFIVSVWVSGEKFLEFNFWFDLKIEVYI